MTGQQPFSVAIVGGGLGGISLGIALQRRNIPFTLYESRGSFTEIGAGINLGPSALRTLRLIDPTLGEKVYNLATRNPPPHEDVWMHLRYAAPWGDHEDGEMFHKISSPPTGNMTLHRQELLALLAEEMGHRHAKFNKKFETYEQTSDHVTLKFVDGTTEEASILVACDGIHSKVRTCMLGNDDPASKAVFSESGAYRALLPMEKAVEVLGESARLGTINFGPGGYLITYPVSGGTKLNCGAWTSRRGQTWPHRDWILPNQQQQFTSDFALCGERVQKILRMFDDDPELWATFQHGNQPDSFTDGLVILTGDGAHSMPPHQGSGASQAIEDSYVLAETLSVLVPSPESGIPSPTAADLKAALRIVEQVRKARFTQVHRYSVEGGDRWFGLFDQKLEGKDLQDWIDETERRLRWIWNEDLATHAEEAKSLLAAHLNEARLVHK
ncbi:putative FAD-binding domain, FAD/NAD(P)-binding domain superfamily [Septoria linicola]|nr:putative FAD-binding domain, FAD/NAD(P)-binding domain superfamily [Septoria linicola]